MTFAGLSRYNVANALAAAAACDALGLSTRQIASGPALPSQLDAAANPGPPQPLRARRCPRRSSTSRTTRRGSTGLHGGGPVRWPGTHAVRLAYGTAGDRTDEILHRPGRHRRRRRRPRHRREAPLPARPRPRGDERDPPRGRAGGRLSAARIATRASELGALQALLARAEPGDVCVVMAHVERSDLFEWLAGEGFRPVDGRSRFDRCLARAAKGAISTGRPSPRSRSARSGRLSLTAPCWRRWSSFQTWLAWSTHTTTTSPSPARSSAARVASSSSRIVVTAATRALGAGGLDPLG